VEQPVTTTSCDHGLELEVKTLQYLGRRLEGGPDREFRVYDFMDIQRFIYRYTQGTWGATSMFSSVLHHLKEGDVVTVKARFGCCSYTYRKAPHHTDEGWLKEAQHFVRPQMKMAPKKRARSMYPFERGAVGSWSEVL
jgi:hypothetical protein